MAAPQYGLIATFDTPGAVMRAAEQVRDAGYRRWDVITPFPIHGIDKAMGVGRSRVPRISLAGGITGFCTGMTMICVTHEMGFARRLANRIIFMDRGEIIEQGTPDEIFSAARSERLQAFLARVLHAHDRPPR